MTWHPLRRNPLPGETKDQFYRRCREDVEMGMRQGEAVRREAAGIGWEG